jgi:hypothetical protein
VTLSDFPRSGRVILLDGAIGAEIEKLGREMGGTNALKIQTMSNKFIKNTLKAVVTL